MNAKNTKNIFKGLATAILSLLLLFLVSCGTKSVLRVPRVGPPLYGVSLNKVAPDETGFLTVYSATTERSVSNEKKSHPHTGYLIRNADGSKFAWIDNSIDASDGTPTLVALPGGSYTVLAQDSQYKRVIVPVLIKPYKTTRVRLDSRSSEQFSEMNSTNAIHLPNGRIVGWRADPAG